MSRCFAHPNSIASALGSIQLLHDGKPRILQTFLHTYSILVSSVPGLEMYSRECGSSRAVGEACYGQHATNRLYVVQVLAYCASGELKTGDENSAVTLGRLPDGLIERFGDKLKAGLLLRFKVGSGGFMLNSERCISGADLQLVGTVTNQIRKADRYSRIVFQWQVRTEQVFSVENLVEKVSENEIAAK